MIDSKEASRIASKFVNEWVDSGGERLAVSLLEEWQFGWFFGYSLAGVEFPENAIFGASPLFVNKSSGELVDLNGKTIEEFKASFSESAG